MAVIVGERIERRLVQLVGRIYDGNAAERLCNDNGERLGTATAWGSDSYKSSASGWTKDQTWGAEEYGGGSYQNTSVGTGSQTTAGSDHYTYSGGWNAAVSSSGSVVVTPYGTDTAWGSASGKGVTGWIDTYTAYTPGLGGGPPSSFSTTSSGGGFPTTWSSSYGASAGSPQFRGGPFVYEASPMSSSTPPLSTTIPGDMINVVERVPFCGTQAPQNTFSFPSVILSPFASSDKKKPGVGEPSVPSAGIGNVDYTTFKQGSRPNCWIAAAVSAFAYQNPEKIKKMIKDNGDGTYTVTLPGPNKSYIVNPSNGASFSSDGNWAKILELALIEYYGDKAKESNGLSYLDVIEVLTGNNVTPNRNISGAGFGTWLESLASKLSKANDGAIVVAGTGYREPTGSAKNCLQAGHTYAVLGFDKATGRVRMRNPHGIESDAHKGRKEPGWGPGEFWLTLEEFEENFLGMGYERK